MKTTSLLLNIFMSFFVIPSLWAGQDNKPILSQRPEFQWEKVKIGQEVSTFPVTGVVIAEEGALHIQSARIGGRVLSLVNEEGGLVKKGDPIFNIFGPECVSIREEKRIAQNSKLEDLTSSIAQRERELNIKVTEKQCQLLADARGVLVKRSVGSGSSFGQGDILAHVLEPERMRIELEIPERSAGSITKGTVVKFRMPSATGFVGSSVVQQVFPIVEEGTRMMKARLHSSKLPPDTKLNSMVFADIELSQNHTCLVVPKTAVTFQDNNSWVIFRNGNDIERVSVIVVGSENGNTLIRPTVKDKIKADDIVATYNVPFLYQEVKSNSGTKK